MPSWLVKLCLNTKESNRNLDSRFRRVVVRRMKKSGEFSCRGETRVSQRCETRLKSNNQPKEN